MSREAPVELGFKRRAWIAIVLALTCFPVPARAEDRVVARVIDGDTLELENGERVRLFGVDTPETKHPSKPVEAFGEEATAFTRQRAEGRPVRLEYEAGVPTKDRYGRTLAYVWLEDGRLLNLEIVRQGYGHAYTKYPFSKIAEFRAAEREAREAGIGLWSRGPRDADAAEPPAATTPGASCARASECCKVCRKGQACGDSCIAASSSCRKGRGCACDAAEVCR